ncbi:MAG: HlyD family efflux transporter periplasmic adaptor subunit [Phycisphaerales bacterium]|nr:HlyD family efflux transporter periplasmic adaptor subunit [Phycisphaerales bacterium]
MIRAAEDAPDKTAKPRPPRTVRRRRSIRRMLVIGTVSAVVLVVLCALLPTTRWAEGTGYLTTDHEAELRPSVEGPIAQWMVGTGQRVEEGQLIIQLNNAVQKADYQQADVELKSKQAQLEQLLASQQLDRAQRKEQIERAQKNLQLAELMYQRMSGGGFSNREVEEARLHVEVAKSELAELQLPRDTVMDNQVTVMKEQVEVAKKAVAAQEAQLRLREVRAPLAGIVQLNRFEPGEVVKPEHVLGQVFDPQAWVVKITLAEESLPYVQVGQPVKVAIAAYPHLRYGYFDAVVSRITPVVTPRQTGNGVYLVEASLNPPSNLTIQPGMTTTAYVNAGKTTWLRRMIGW